MAEFIFRALSSGSTPHQWQSMFWYGRLVYQGNKGVASYTIEKDGESPVFTVRGDTSKRGAEYSALEVYDGKLLTFCDRTGNCDELFLSPDLYTGKLQVRAEALLDSKGLPVRMLLGDGSKDKPLKCEWATERGGKLIVGSTGKGTNSEMFSIYCPQLVNAQGR